MYTLHNCLSYSAVSTLLEKGQLNERDKETVRGMGILEGVNLTTVTEPIDACMHGFCREITDTGECYAHEVHVSCRLFVASHVQCSGVVPSSEDIMENVSIYDCQRDDACFSC